MRQIICYNHLYFFQPLTACPPSHNYQMMISNIVFTGHNVKSNFFLKKKQFLVYDKRDLLSKWWLLEKNVKIHLKQMVKFNVTLHGLVGYGWMELQEHGTSLLFIQFDFIQNIEIMIITFNHQQSIENTVKIYSTQMVQNRNTKNAVMPFCCSRKNILFFQYLLYVAFKKRRLCF